MVEEKRPDFVRPILHHGDQFNELPKRHGSGLDSNLAAPSGDYLGIRRDSVDTAALADTIDLAVEEAFP